MPIRPTLASTPFLRVRRRNTYLKLVRYGLAVLLAIGALAAGLTFTTTRQPLPLICTFAVLLSALIGGYAAGWMSLAITGVGLWFMAPDAPQLHSKGFQSSLVLWFAYVGLGVVLVEVIRHLQKERKHLLERDERLRLARRAARIWFWELDLESNLLRWSREGQPGTTSKDYQHLSLEHYVNQRVHPEDRERILNALFEAAAGHHRLELEYRVLEADGSLRWLSAKGKIFDANGSSLMLGMASDVTGQKQADEVRSHFRAVLGSLSEGVCYLDTSGAVQYLNAAAERMLGYDSDEVRGKQFHELVHVGCDPSHAESCWLLNSMQAGYPCPIREATLTTRSGEPLVTEYTSAPVASDGVTLGAVIMFRDISEWKHAEQALRASEKMAATGRIAATISHELRNPLDSVMQLLYLVKQSQKLGDAERQQLELVDQELRRMMEVTQQTLAMHRQSVQMVPVNVAKLIDGVMLLYNKKIRSQKIQIEKRYEWQGEVPGFPAELRQVFTNLIVNAVDAMPGGGKLCVHVRRHKEPSSERQGTLVALLDTGVGIPRSVRKGLFQPFFTTKGEKGSGVGLWVSSGIVQRHGGSVRVHSNSRPGRSYTCFQVFLPENHRQVRMQEPSPQQQQIAHSSPNNVLNVA